MSKKSTQVYTVSLNGKNYVAQVKGDDKIQVDVNGKSYNATISEGGEVSQVSESNAPASTGETIAAPLAGSIVKVCVSEGQSVSAGEVLLVLEAMKMETEIKAPNDASIGQVNVKEGDSVSTGDTLLTL